VLGLYFVLGLLSRPECEWGSIKSISIKAGEVHNIERGEVNNIRRGKVNNDNSSSAAVECGSVVRYTTFQRACAKREAPLGPLPAGGHLPFSSFLVWSCSLGILLYYLVLTYFLKTATGNIINFLTSSISSSCSCSTY